MSPVETKDESSPGPPGQLKDIQPNDEDAGENTETKEMSPEIEAQLKSFYNQSGTIQPKPVQAKPPTAQDQK